MPNKTLLTAVALLVLATTGQVRADCTIAEATLALDPVEAGFCESDAVFVGAVDSRSETERGFREKGSERMQHQLIETSALRITRRYKGKLPDKVEMIVNLYDKQSPAFSFERGKQYLVFAKRLAGQDQYAGATATCSVQATLPIAESEKAVEQLEQHRKGRKVIDCGKIRTKQWRPRLVAESTHFAGP